MKKNFTLRVDIESFKGLKEGIPKFLDLLKKHKIKASFYVVMGGESNLLELLFYRRRIPNAMERKIFIWSLKDKLRMAFFPKDFVKENEEILRRIIKEGHELGIHGWKHRAWTRGIDKINIEKHVKKSIDRYEEIFHKKPISFSAPGFNNNEEILKILEKNKIQFISDFPGRQVKKFGKIKNVPITLNGKENTPIIEYLVSQGKNDEEILEIIDENIEAKEILSFYMHDLFEARFKIELLGEIFKLIKKKKLKNKRIIDY